MAYRVDRSSEPSDVLIYTEGNKVISRDVYPGGDVSCLKSVPWECKDEDEAEVLAYILNDPRSLIYISLGKLTQEVFEKMVVAWRQHKAGKASTPPEATAG